jgi:hypothetical protein
LNVHESQYPKSATLDRKKGSLPVEGTHPGGDKRDSLQEKKIVRVSPYRRRWPVALPVRRTFVGELCFAIANNNSLTFVTPEYILATQVWAIALVSFILPKKSIHFVFFSVFELETIWKSANKETSSIESKSMPFGPFGREKYLTTDLLPRVWRVIMIWKAC